METSLRINDILYEFHKISGFRISIYDTEFNEIYAYPKNLSPYCSVVQRDAENKKECVKNDRLAFENVKRTGEVTVYRCAHGLFEAVAPIYHYGIISGFLMMGQVCDDKELYTDFLNASLRKVIRDEYKVKEIFLQIKDVPKELFNSYITIMRVIAEYMTQTNRVFFGNDTTAKLIMKYLEQNYSSKITLETIAEKFSCSQSTIVKNFKKEYNTTIMNALIDIRLKKAADHLKSGRLSVKEIASLCGFSEQNYFSKAFAKKYGCSPTEFRRNIKESDRESRSQ